MFVHYEFDDSDHEGEDSDSSSAEEDAGDFKDAELLASAKKCRSVRNLQPLEILCMKAVVKNFARLSNSTLLKNLAPNVKTSFLELLTQLQSQGKIIPLRVEERVKLINILLHETLKRFDFSVLICRDEEFKEGSRESVSKWQRIYDQMWTSLAAKCPNLLHIKERRPVMPNESDNKISLDTNVLAFSKLLSLDTICGERSFAGQFGDEMCAKLKHLKILKASVLFSNEPHLENLNKLKDLEEVHLTKWTPAAMGFGLDVFYPLSKLRNYSLTYTISNFTDFPTESSFSHRNHGALERLTVDHYKTENDLAWYAAKFPNLRYLEMANFPEKVDPRLILKFKNLTALEISYKKLAFKILTLIGPNLNELKFRDERIDLEKHSNSEVLKGLLLCPNLENFECLDLKGPINFQVPVVAEKLKLKKLHLSGDLSDCGAEGFLPLVLSAPLLENVSLRLTKMSKKDFESLKVLLSNGDVLQNLARVDLKFSSKMLLKMDSLGKHIISFCPKLESAQFDHICYKYGQTCGVVTSFSLKPFMDMLAIF